MIGLKEFGVGVDVEFLIAYKEVYPVKQEKIPRRKVPVFGDFIQQDLFQEHFLMSQKELNKLNDEFQKRFIR